MARPTTIAHRKQHHRRRSNQLLWDCCVCPVRHQRCRGCLLWWGGSLLLWYYLYYVLVLHHHAARSSTLSVLPGITDDRRVDAPGIPRSRDSNTAVYVKTLSPTAPKSSSSQKMNADPHEEEDDGQATYSLGKATLNTIPLQWRSDGPPPVAQVDCLGLEDRHDNNNNNSTLSWMFRSCEYRNLCIDMHTHEYVIFVNDDDNVDTVKDNAQQVALGPINPRWNMGNGLDRGWDKVRWKPSVVRRSTWNKVTSYYQLPETTTLLPFHSMAGHNIGHLAWDDLWAVYKLGLQFSAPAAIPGNVLGAHNNIWLLRHQINETLYANCDIRRNKRLQCRANFERFVPLLGMDPHTFSTTKQLQLLLWNDTSHARTATTDTHLVCARRGLAGMGLLQDHGFRDHGWEDSTPVGGDASVLTVPHNLGAGRTFYDYAQLLRHHALLLDTTSAKRTTTTTTSSIERPVITFSLRSSQDWMRRQNFTAQIAALQEPAESFAAATPTWQIQALDLRELTLTEQVRVAGTTQIFVTTCGGGAVTATFLPRDAALVVFYDATGGLDFDTLSSNHQPARLDWDLLNYAAGAHLRVHWLPVNTMNEPADLRLFALLIQHEIAMARQWMDNDGPA